MRINKYNDIQAGRQADKQAGRQADKQAGRQPASQFQVTYVFSKR